MKRSLYQMFGMVLLGVMFNSCEPAEEPFTENELNAVTSAESTIQTQEEEYPDYFLAQLANFESTDLNFYKLDFMGRTVQGSGDNKTTTFKYRLSGTGETAQLNSFSLNLPGCAGKLVNYSPEQAAKVSEGSIQWNNSVSQVGSQDYSITFSGNIPLGIISSTVARGNSEETKDIVGPCDGVYTLSGSIFIDANRNKILDTSESGIPGFDIRLKDENDLVIGTETTSENGSYSFMVLKGIYSISVGDDLLNDDNYTSSTPANIFLGEVAEERTGNNFGYLVDTGKIKTDLEEGYYNLNTEPTKFWIQQLRNAGKKNNYSVKQINDWLVEIEGLFLDDPFQFGADKRSAAMEYLTRPIKTDLDEFLQQLLTAELNVVSGRGARNDQGQLNQGFNWAMLIYSEAIACSEMRICPAETSSSGAVKTQTKRVSSGDTQMLISFNGSGGLGR